MEPKPKKLLDQVRDTLRLKHYAYSTEKTFERHQIIVRDTKGNEDRVTLLPQSIAPRLCEHLLEVKQLHETALANGYGTVELPYALSRKYPNAEHEWLWQYVFPSEKVSVDPRSKAVRRHHLDESGLQKAVRRVRCWHRQTCDTAYLSSLLCHPSARSRL